MVYDTARQRVVLLLGADARYVNDETWEWDGANWTRSPTQNNPPLRYQQAMAYDQARGRAVLFGGRLGWELGDTWHFGTVRRAQANPIGTGCTGARGVPTLTGTAPYLGSTALVIDVLNARPASIVVLGLASGTQNAGVGGGCTLYLREPIILLPQISNGFGVASVRLSIPWAASLRGTSVYAQAFVSDSQSPVLGVAFSAGRQMVIGD